MILPARRDGSAYAGMETMDKLKYGNTNTFFIRGHSGGLLIDTDYAGTLQALYKALKTSHIVLQDISYVMATHYHPDHMGLVGDLMKQGVKLLLVDVQKDAVHYSDGIFEREKLPYSPIHEASAKMITCGESSGFLADQGIAGSIIHTPSHSKDSVSLILENGDCFAGDLEPYEYIAAYENNAALKSDWEHILSFHPKRIFYAHRPEQYRNG